MKRIIVCLFAVASLMASAPSQAAPEKIYVSNMLQIDAVVNSKKSGFTLIWSRDHFASNEDAQLMLDVLRLSEAWDTWFMQNGEDVTGLKKRMRFVYADPKNLVDDFKRMELIETWFRGQLEINEALALHADMLLEEIPREVAVAGIAMKDAYNRMVDHLDALMMAELSKPSLSVVDAPKAPTQTKSPVGPTVIPTGPQRSCESLFFPNQRAFRVI